MMNPKANAVLAMLLTSTSNSKSNRRYKTERPVCDSHTEQEAKAVTIALVDAGRGWSAVKRECVLLKGGK